MAAVFLANVLSAGFGATALADCLEHDVNHAAAMHDHSDADSSAAEQSDPLATGPAHDCHASQCVKTFLATSLPSIAPGAQLPSAAAALPIRRIEALPDLLFRPPQRAVQA